MKKVNHSALKLWNFNFGVAVLQQIGDPYEIKKTLPTWYEHLLSSVAKTDKVSKSENNQSDSNTQNFLMLRTD